MIDTGKSSRTGSVTRWFCGVPHLLCRVVRRSKQLALEAENADNRRHLIDRAQLGSGGIRVALNLKRRIAEPIDSGGQ